MSGTFPTTPAPASLTPITVRKNYTDIMHGGARESRQITGGQVWNWKATYQNLTVSEWAVITAFLAKQRGSFGKFQFNIHTAGYPAARGIATGTPLTKGAASIGANSLDTDGWTINQTGIMKAGDFITVAGHKKLYMITDDANSDGIGDATLNVEPELFFAYADNAVITIANVLVTVMVQDRFEIPINAPQLVDLALSFEEVTN